MTIPAQTEIGKRLKRDIIYWRTWEVANALGVAITALASLKDPLMLVPALAFFLSGYIAQININRKKTRLAAQTY